MNHKRHHFKGTIVLIKSHRTVTDLYRIENTHRR